MAGMIVWHELFTTDVDAATGFCAELLDAEIETQTCEGNGARRRDDPAA